MKEEYCFGLRDFFIYYINVLLVSFFSIVSFVFVMLAGLFLTRLAAGYPVHNKVFSALLPMFFVNAGLVMVGLIMKKNLFLKFEKPPFEL